MTLHMEQERKTPYTETVDDSTHMKKAANTHTSVRKRNQPTWEQKKTQHIGREDNLTPHMRAMVDMTQHMGERLHTWEY